MDPVFFRVEELLLQTSSSDEHSTAAGLCVKHGKSLKRDPPGWAGQQGRLSVHLPPSKNESGRKKTIFPLIQPPRYSPVEGLTRGGTEFPPGMPLTL